MLPFLGHAAIFGASVVEVTLSNSTEVAISSLFTSADWASAKLKRVRIPSGVTIGSTHQATPALNCGTGRGGLLEIVLDGNLDGAGGITNGQNGGDALYAPQTGVKLKGGGNSRPGGGAGGDGGNGGAGVYYTGRTVTEGPVYDGSHFWAVQTFWDGTNAAPPNGPYWDPWDASYSYSQGAFQESRNYVSSGDNPHTYGSANLYAISRQKTVYDVPNYTTGGTKGTHGRGQGYDGAAASGTAGSAGGTNAGAGGGGGAGGAFGSSGTNGTAGANGNNGSGAAATNGGLSGYGLNGNANVDRSAFTGTILGRIV
jgi:hypothetical protein